MAMRQRTELRIITDSFGRKESTNFDRENLGTFWAIHTLGQLWAGRGKWPCLDLCNATKFHRHAKTAK
jgi:hypothetical protein